MRHFKHNPGFSFIEMMIALILLSMFGTSIFIVQSKILSNVLKTHQSLIADHDVTIELFNFMIKLEQAILEKKSPEKVTIVSNKNNPDRTITITLKDISQNSAVFKDFHKNIRIAQITIDQKTRQDVWHIFIHIPELNPQNFQKNRQQPKEQHE